MTTTISVPSSVVHSAPLTELPSNLETLDAREPVCLQLKTSIYQADQQAKLLQLQAEVELLWQQLQQT
ncbi:hypothetical protein KR51_00009010 [Rubidibacter lacunae KORDI 51-2]|uniref:Uncharacterized protein n=1 Tax=Rubidibacter lacunae KORDI 51-2 TaxID=582515 RepID=U5DRR2_9CHRO|nr:hypothetical protein [Rubidibacter lacunae]ERN42380.1 hypothetical protein KR51_00009010 [Rubidibacter lacunae KORDI 51-2]